MKDTLVVFQCCKRKDGIEQFPREERSIRDMVPKTQYILEKAVTRFSEEGIIDCSTPKITALSLYNGAFYRVHQFRASIAHELHEGNTDFLIMSAGFGFVHPFERIHRYEQRMHGRVTRYWLNVGLPDVLTEYIQKGRFRRAYGFFSKSADYQKIFENVSWQDLPMVHEAGYLYLSGIKGATNVLQTASKLLLDMLRTRFMDKPTHFQNAQVNFVPLRVS